MREILFRGRNKRGRWLYGMPYSYSAIHGEIDSIINPTNNRLSTIDLSTLGQFTGLTDKNGAKIFEGDVVRLLYTDWPSWDGKGFNSLDEYLDSLSLLAEIKWRKFGWAGFLNGYSMDLNVGPHGHIKIIGNIHDNPELLTTKS